MNTPVANYTTTMPLKKKTVKNLKIVSETVAVLQVRGDIYVNDGTTEKTPTEERYFAEISEVNFNGVNIKNVMEGCDKTEDIILYFIRSYAAAVNKFPLHK